MTAAGRLFYTRGVNAVGMDEIARTAGVSKLTLYRHFGSKEGLLDAVLRARTSRIAAWTAAGAASETTPAARVLAVFEALRRSQDEPHFAGCAVVNAVVDTRGGDAGVKAAARDHLDGYRALFAAELRDAGVSEAAAAAVARQLLLLVEGGSVVSAIDDATAGDDAIAAARTLLTAAGVPA
jgi:AcrR family transcriptional regulator